MAVNTIGAGVILNEGSIDVDFRVESNGNANMLFVDGGNDRVGIGIASPAELLHLKKTATDSNVILKYGNDSRDWMLGVHGDDSDKFKLETHDKTDVIVIDSAGKVGIGTASPAVILHLSDATPALLMTDELDENLYLSSRNLYHVGVCDTQSIDPVSLIGYENVVLTKAALKKVEAML